MNGMRVKIMMVLFNFDVNYLIITNLNLLKVRCFGCGLRKDHIMQERNIFRALNLLEDYV